VTSPNGGEVLAIGSTRRFDWAATDDFAVQSVDLYLSRSAPTGPWELLAAGAPNTGRYDWTVTGPDVDHHAWFLLVARDYAGNLGSDLSNGAFSLLMDPLDVRPLQHAAFTLAPPIPNPSHSVTRLAFTVPRAARLRLSLVDIQGREVAEIASGQFGPGLHSATLEASRLASGLYFARLVGAGVELRRRVVIVR
jgi:hypothetical protein